MEDMTPSTISEVTTATPEQTITKVVSPVPVTTTKSLPLKPQTPKTIRIHVNTTDQPRPVIFNYRQLYKRELKKFETAAEAIAPTIDATTTEMSLDSADDLFYKELLKKAESYAMDEDDVDSDGSDEETTTVGNKKQVGNDYDFEDPFIDDSEMMLDEPQEYSAPEFDGFFVYHGPLDGHENNTSTTTEKSKATAPKRKAPAKAKTTTSTTAASGSTSSTSNTGNSNNKRGNSSNTSGGNTAADKSRKKASDDGDKTTTQSTSTNGTVSKVKKSSTTSTTTKSTSATSKTTTTSSASTNSSNSSASRKTTTSSDQPAKKRKKLDTKDSDHAKSTVNSPSLSVNNEEPEKKKKSTPGELKPLDPEIEQLMAKLRRDVVHEDFENKAKFPLALKPTVLEAGLIMLRKNKEIDENLVYHLMTILPYNRFTLKKFLTTKSGQMRVDELQQEIDELAILLKQTIDKMMPEQQRLFDEKLAQASSEPANPDEEAPQPKFKCNDEVRKILYDIIQSEEQSIHIANQVAIHKDSEKKNEGLASDGKARKLMYQRLLSCWPEGWMNSYEMSRQYSQYKLKASLSEKKANNAAPSDAKKRKRATPQSSPSDEGLRKKQSIIDSGIIPPDAHTFQQKIKATIPPSVITIDDDDDDNNNTQEDTVKPSLWKPNSMKIEALISGPANSNEKKKSD